MLGEQCPGVVLGVAVGKGVAGRVGGSGIWRKPAPVSPTFLQTHPFLIPSGKHHLTHLPQVQCSEKREGFRESCLLPLSFSLSG